MHIVACVILAAILDFETWSGAAQGGRAFGRYQHILPVERILFSHEEPARLNKQAFARP